VIVTDEESLSATAQRWWPSQGNDEAYDVVSRIVQYRHDLVPDLIRALVDTAPGGGLPFIGTSLIEDLVMQTEFDGLPTHRVVDLLLAADLDARVVFGILSGVYAELLAEINAAVRLRGVLPPEQIAWLLNSEAPERLSNRGVTVADGDGVRFEPGETEWMRLYGPRIEGDA
jgi:hypothetical protein